MKTNFPWHVMTPLKIRNCLIKLDYLGHKKSITIDALAYVIEHFEYESESFAIKCEICENS